MTERLKVSVYGKVQGVGYRLFCKRRAKELKVDGYARNMPDGRVELMLAGEDQALAKMLEALRQGPPFAQVLGGDVETTSEPISAGFMTGSAD